MAGNAVTTPPFRIRSRAGAADQLGLRIARGEKGVEWMDGN